MDPASALGMASAVIQFIQFASVLFKGAHTVHQAARNPSAGSKDLENIYSTLSKLSSSLAAESNQDLSSILLTDKQRQLQDLAVECKKDCDELLDKVKKLRGYKASGKVWKMFKEALREGLNMREDTLCKIQDRIAEHEQTMILEIGAINMEISRDLRGKVDQLAAQNVKLSAPLGARLEEIRNEIHKIREEINAIGSKKLKQTKNDGEIRNAISEAQFEQEMNGLTTRLRNVSLQSDSICRKGKILASLELTGRVSRFSHISEAHEGTFQWSFQSADASDDSDSDSDNDSDRTRERRKRQGEGKGKEGDGRPSRPIERSGLLRWLETEAEPIFWVTGKPGSGKSTFMKFVSNDSRTRKALSTWANRPSEKIILASHFFWSTGSEMQRSQHGLWRSLLFDILRQAPDLIPLICGDKFRELTDTEPLSLTVDLSWSTYELRGCIQRVADLSQQAHDIRVCVFVDGLDEFEHDQLDHHDLVEILLKLSRSKSIKICVSSRPWNVFEQSLGKFSKLYMQNFTRRDIHKFAKDRLTSHPSWNEILQAEEAALLVKTISERAQGVFLWVFLVTRLLREGLHNEDTFEELQETLDTLPTDLELFFKKMLDSVDRIYHRKMAGFLSIAAEATEALQFEVYHFHELEYKNPDFATDEGITQFQPPDVEKIRRRVAKRFQAFCKCLLEIGEGGRVLFLHRTVGDWLGTIPMREFLKQKAAVGFDAELSTLRAYLALYKHPYVNNYWTDMKGVGIIVEERGKQMDILDQVFRLAHQKLSQDQDLSVHQAVCDILDRFHAATFQLFEAGMLKFVDGNRTIDNLLTTKLIDAHMDGYYKLKPMPGNSCQAKRTAGETVETREAKRARQPSV